MANQIYDLGLQGILDRTINLGGGQVTAGLLRGATFDDSHEFLADVTGAGATLVGHALLTGETFANGVYDAADVALGAVTAGSACSAIILYQDTGTPSTSRLIAFWDTGIGLPITPDGGAVTIDWDNGANRIFSLGPVSTLAVGAIGIASLAALGLASVVVEDTLFGAWVATIGGETQAAAIARFNAAAGASIRISRAYDSGGWTTSLLSAANQRGLGSIPMCMSFETNASHSLANIAAGAYDSDINSLLASISAKIAGDPAKRVYLANHHEFDAKVAQSTYTFAAVSPAMLHIDSLIHAHGDPLIIPTIIFTGFDFSDRLAAYWPALSSSWTQVLSCDPYASSAESVAGVCDPQIALVAGAHETFAGKPRYAASEIGGSPIGGSATDAQMASFAAQLSHLDGLAEYVAYFDSGAETISTIPAAIENYGAVIRAS